MKVVRKNSNKFTKINGLNEGLQIYSYYQISSTLSHMINSSYSVNGSKYNVKLFIIPFS